MRRKLDRCDAGSDGIGTVRFPRIGSGVQSCCRDCARKQGCFARAAARTRSSRSFSSRWRKVLQPGEAVPERKERQLQPVGHAALVEDAVQVMLDGHFAQLEPLGDVSITQPLGKRHEDLALSR